MNIIEQLQKKQIRFNEQQEQAVLDDSRYLLLLAVPGSGKTTVMVSRLARMIGENGIEPQQLLTMTFSREAARDMAMRFHALFPELAVPRFSTIHSFCHFVLRQYAVAYRRQLPRNIEAENTALKRSVLLRRIYQNFHQDYLGDDALDILSSEISFIKNRMIRPEDFSAFHFETQGLDTIFQEYENFKRNNGLMDFDDMLSICLEIFDKCPQLLSSLCRQFPYISVDEAQDTSPLQHKIIQRLADKGSLFMVGDEDQSIYSFRGACPELLLDFPRSYPGAKILKMEQNFRSAREIVESADRFIRQNKHRYDKNMYCDKPDGDCIYDMELDDYRSQYGQVLTLLDALPPKDSVAVLYRNNESAVPLIDLLDKKGIPFYAREHRASFFSHFVVRDMLSFFRLSRCPNDIEAFRNIYYKLYLSRKIYQYAERHYTEYDNIFDLVLTVRMLPKYTAQRIRDIRDRLPKLCGMRPLRAISYIEDSLGYHDFLSSRADNGFTAETLQQKLNILKSVAAGYDTIDSFVSRLQELERLIGKSKDRTGMRITLSTIHSAKGQEFDHVILLDLIEGIFPGADAVKEKNSGNPFPYEEEVRLFYVAATRAKKRLYLMEARKINGCPAYPSRFLSHLLGEMPQEPSGMEGRRIYHSTYRNGVILSQEGDTITAEFELFGQRSFSLSYCMEHGVIKIMN